MSGRGGTDRTEGRGGTNTHGSVDVKDQKRQLDHLMAKGDKKPGGGGDQGFRAMARCEKQKAHVLHACSHTQQERERDILVHEHARIDPRTYNHMHARCICSARANTRTHTRIQMTLTS